MVIVQSEDTVSITTEEKAKLRERISELEREVVRYEDIFNSALLVVGNEFIKPLTSIRGYMGLIEDSLNDSGIKTEKNSRYIRKIEKAVKHLEELVYIYVQMLGWGKESKLVGESAKVKLRSFVDQMINKHCEDPSRLVNGVDKNLPEVVVRSRHLELVLGNIFSNAEKYGGDMNPARVSAEMVDEENGPGTGTIVIEVADYGTGIPEEIREKVFLPFFRGESGSEGGLGLGLAIAKNVVSLMGGDIGINSREGIGTIVSVSIPVGINGLNRGAV